MPSGASPGRRRRDIGAVGTGSLRGMFLLRALHDAGCAVWPFDGPVLPLAVEIYPRLLSGPVVKSSSAARAAHLEHYGATIPPGLRERAATSEDAFDAAVSAVEMSRRIDELLALPVVVDPILRIEGAIWPDETPITRCGRSAPLRH